MAFTKGKVTISSPAAKGEGKDIDFPKGPEDTVSAVRWSPMENLLAASSWDGNVYIYDAKNANKTEDIRPVTAINISSPVLDCDFSKDGTLAAGAAADSKVHVLDIASGQTIELGSHSKPVRAVRFIQVPFANSPIIASGSWDKTIRYWDMRQPQPITTIELPERVWAMDASTKFLAAATANNELQFIDLRQRDNFKVWKNVKSPLDHQITSLSLTKDGSHWAAGCIGGRAAVQAVDDRITNFTNLTFKCHRDPDNTTNKHNTHFDVYAVNAVAFCPTNRELLATAGSDGTYTIWNVRMHRRMRAYPKVEAPVTAVSFRHDGKALAYAVGYDWAKGYMGNKPGAVCKVVMRVFEDELK
ncbi:hypothetical protein VTJ49DRAFT_3568 [Mycothermus thermophilus]|uniref:Uncharacterized protein n=1 Tax=Humicola insolens TaxID=85995 RepID=A0ABR3V763_HUMIN